MWASHVDDSTPALEPLLLSLGICISRRLSQDPELGVKLKDSRVGRAY